MHETAGMDGLLRNNNLIKTINQFMMPKLVNILKSS